MNRTKILVGLFLTSIFFTGCKEAEEVFYVNFYADYETEFNIEVTPSSTNKGSIDGTFTLNETIDPTTNSDYLKYIDNIKEVDITEVSGEVISISKNVTLQSCTLEVTNPDNNATWSFTDEFIQLGTILTLGNDQGQWDEMTDIMFGKVPFTVNIAGAVDDEEVEFTVLFSLKSEVTASPIN